MTIRRVNDEQIKSLELTAICAVEYVAAANYRDREIRAIRAIQKSAEIGRFVDPDALKD